MTIFVQNTNVLELIGLQDKVTEAYINDATVQVTVKTVEGTEVSGTTWPVTMNYVAASNGIYRGILPDTVALEDNITYVAHITADAGASRKGNWQHPFRAQIRV